MSKYSEKVICSTIRADCTNEEIREARIHGKNYWAFEFYVPRENANEYLYNILMKLENYGFCEFGVHLGPEGIVDKSDIWTMDAIEHYLNNNLGLSPSPRISLIMDKK